MEAENEEMDRYIRKLEKEQRDEVDERQMFTKETTTLSKRQAHERLVSQSEHGKHYGLENSMVCNLILCASKTLRETNIH